ncbi:serine hydrolase [Aliiglaciecola sp. CAU 1673]|uniref:serine hydrolase domain-containing protein n=1 Tax=Aliiglaciecola sp. CAU 1673 TaxID=3032595 RepID=UPI0023DC0817|nr:serine hydrolase domain-containing protein [Aliiglaciecola sp. CAU 1673]MDF2178393.1 serine hydrolase [Aliiglaciecola sp. CAU 1673]
MPTHAIPTTRQWLLSFAALLFPVLASAGDPARLQTQLSSFVTDKNLPGMVVMIDQGQQTLFHAAIGHADREKQIPMTPEQRFRWFSMSKPVTALAMLKSLRDNGKALQSTVQDLYPSFDLDTAIPVHNLLTHTAGLGYGGEWSSVSGWLYALLGPLERAGSLNEMMSKLDGIPLHDSPGTTWRYSMSSDVQGALIEQISGQRFERYMQERIFAPLEMNTTGFIYKGKADTSLAPIYRYDPDKKQSVVIGDPSEWDKSVAAGGSGMAGSAQDFMRFLRVLRFPEQYPQFPQEWVQAMTHNQLPESIGAIPEAIYPNSGYGFGLGIKLQDEQYLSQGSYYWAGLAGSFFFVDPEKELAVVVMIQELGARKAMEKHLIPMIYQWLQEPVKALHKTT